MGNTFMITSCAKLLDMDDIYRDSYGHLVTITLTRVDFFYHGYPQDQLIKLIKILYHFDVCIDVCIDFTHTIV